MCLGRNANYKHLFVWLLVWNIKNMFLILKNTIFFFSRKFCLLNRCSSFDLQAEGWFTWMFIFEKPVSFCLAPTTSDKFLTYMGTCFFGASSTKPWVYFFQESKRRFCCWVWFSTPSVFQKKKKRYPWIVSWSRITHKFGRRQ